MGAAVKSKGELTLLEKKKKGKQPTKIIKKTPGVEEEEDEARSVISPAVFFTLMKAEIRASTCQVGFAVRNSLVQWQDH